MHPLCTPVVTRKAYLSNTGYSTSRQQWCCLCSQMPENMANLARRFSFLLSRIVHKIFQGDQTAEKFKLIKRLTEG